MVYLAYIVLAVTVVIFSIKASDYVELIDKKTNISGAFLGGVMLAAITSLPELFTSISAVLMFNNSELVLGNILGSNIFNLFTLAVVIVFFMKGFINGAIGNNHLKTSLFTLVVNIILFFPIFFGENIDVFNISIVSILIMILYFLSLKFLAGDQVETTEEEKKDDSNLTLKQIIVRFILASIGLVIASILITYVTDIISVKLNLAASLSGALFLGIATSLPEVTSVIALAKKFQFNLAVGTIIGSNMFNLFIISITDILYIGNSVYFTTLPQTKILLLFTTISTIIASIILVAKNAKAKSNVLYYVLTFGCVVSYLAYLLLSL